LRWAGKYLSAGGTSIAFSRVACTFKRSNDPKFAGKVEDIIGLYMNAPAHTDVVSIRRRHRRSFAELRPIFNTCCRLYVSGAKVRAKHIKPGYGSKAISRKGFNLLGFPKTATPMLQLRARNFIRLAAVGCKSLIVFWCKGDFQRKWSASGALISLDFDTGVPTLIE
jgi:hypothetical protein